MSLEQQLAAVLTPQGSLLVRSDEADMCKHVAAVMYGVGARLDQRPELLFRLCQVDETELISHAGQSVPLTRKGIGSARVLESGGLGDMFGIDLAEARPSVEGASRRSARASVKKPGKKRPPVKKKAAPRQKRTPPA